VLLCITIATCAIFFFAAPLSELVAIASCNDQKHCNGEEKDDVIITKQGTPFNSTTAVLGSDIDNLIRSIQTTIREVQIELQAACVSALDDDDKTCSSIQNKKFADCITGQDESHSHDQRQVLSSLLENLSKSLYELRTNTKMGNPCSWDTCTKPLVTLPKQRMVNDEYQKDREQCISGHMSMASTLPACKQRLATTSRSKISSSTRSTHGSNSKIIIGEVERVNIHLAPPSLPSSPNKIGHKSLLQVQARIDTGATSNSVHAFNVTEFKRDGDRMLWVRFHVSSTLLQSNSNKNETSSGAFISSVNRDLHEVDEVVMMELPIVKYVRVYQQSTKKGIRRPVVHIPISLGDNNDDGDKGRYKASSNKDADVSEFTLADRSHLEHVMILGRKFLDEANAIVDVGRRFVAGGNALL